MQHNELESLVPALSPALKSVVVASSPLLAFFNAPILGALLLFVFIDLLTGLWKAMLLKKVRSRIFGKALDRFLVYIVAYAVLHVMTLVLPVGPFLAALPEYIVLTGYALKESLSVLENLKAILMARGQHSPVLDAVISRLGLDLEHIVAQVEGAKSDAGLPASQPNTPDAGSR